MKKLRAQGQRIVNEDGAHVILHGVNLVCKEKKKGYVEPCDEGLFAWFREQGYNVVRLGLIWDGVEPEPGEYDDVYLGKIKQQAAWAEQNGIYVFLDMHQDLYSVLYGDGAPAWATLTDDLPHVEGQLWSDAYLESPAVNRALDRFWDNAAGPGGVGLQERYAAMWRHVAEFFSDCPNLIGYDLMNEPYPGTDGQEVLGAIIAAYAETVLGLTDADPGQLAELWFDEEKKLEVLAGMAKMEIYRPLVESATEASQSFEREKLAGFFNRTAGTIREVDPERLMLLETSYFANMGIESGLQPLTDRSGNRDAGMLYAPHGYDLVVDTNHYEAYNQDRVDLIFSVHRRVQQRLNVPALIGEWGAYNDHPATYGLTKAIVALFEEYLWSSTYWCWTDGFKEAPYAAGLNRAYPHATGGELLRYRYDYDAGRLEMEYVPDGGETVIYHPHAARLGEGAVVITGAEGCQVEIRPYRGMENRQGESRPDGGAQGGLVTVRAPKGDASVSVRIGG